MLKKIGTDEIRKKMGEILDCVNLRGDEFIIERKQKPLAALIPLSKLEAMTKLAKDYVLEQIVADQSLNLSEKEIDALVNEAKHSSRKTKSQKTKRLSRKKNL